MAKKTKPTRRTFLATGTAAATYVAAPALANVAPKRASGGYTLVLTFDVPAAGTIKSAELSTPPDTTALAGDEDNTPGAPLTAERPRRPNRLGPGMK